MIDEIAAVDEGVSRQELGETYQKSEAEMIASVFVEILRLAIACEWAIEDKRVVSEAIREQLGPDIESLGITGGKVGLEQVAKAVVEILWLAHAHRWPVESKDIILEAVKNQLAAVRTSDE